MYYSESIDDYEREIWAHALGGGKINFHPVYGRPRPPRLYSYNLPLRGELMKGAGRIQLLNDISDSSIDCPVAVVFGHACAMNWASPGFDDVGMTVADKLWQSGYYADLIPADGLHHFRS